MSKLPDRELAKLAAHYAQEIMLDVATPGKEAKDRAVRNAQLLKDAMETWASYRGWDMRELMKEIWPNGNPRVKGE